MEWTFQPIDSSVQRDFFDCRISELNEYLKRYAKQNDKKGIAKTFVVIPKAGSREVAGYYSVSMAKIEFESLPGRHAVGLPRYPVPAMRVGKLAVDQSIQGRGLESELLVDALKRAVSLSQQVGIFAVLVDALSDEAKGFYLKYNFVPLQDQKLSLFLPMKTIQKAFG